MSEALNRLADNLPNFLLRLEELKVRQDAQEAFNRNRANLLSQTIRANDLKQEVQNARITQTIRANDLKQEAQNARITITGVERERSRRADMLQLEDARVGGAAAVYGADQVARDFPQGIPAKREKKPKEPKEAAVVGRRIEANRQSLLDPNVDLNLLPEQITEIRTRVGSAAATYKQLTGRDYPIDLSQFGPQPVVQQPPAPPPAPQEPSVTAATFAPGAGSFFPGGIPTAAPTVTPVVAAPQAPEGFTLMQNAAGDQILFNTATGEQRPVE